MLNAKILFRTWEPNSFVCGSGWKVPCMDNDGSSGRDHTPHSVQTAHALGWLSSTSPALIPFVFRVWSLRLRTLRHAEDRVTSVMPPWMSRVKSLKSSVSAKNLTFVHALPSRHSKVRASKHPLNRLNLTPMTQNTTIANAQNNANHGPEPQDHA